MIEFGKYMSVSKHFFDLDPVNHMDLVKSELTYSFNSAKEKHFPEWPGEFKVVEGPLTRTEVLVRVDGEEVPDEVWDRYNQWQLGELDSFDFGDEYAQKTYFNYTFGWYAAIPEEFYIAEKV